MSTHLTNVLNVQHAIEQLTIKQSLSYSCLLYTSDAADE